MKNPSIIKLLVGALLTITGIYMWFNPMATLVAAAVYLGIVFIVTGAAYVVQFFNRKNSRLLTYGVINILIGLLLVSNTGIVATSMPIILGLWILFNSVVQLSNSVELKQMKLSFWIYPMISSVIGIVFSLLLLTNMAAGVLTVAILIGTYLVIYGLTEISEYFMLK